MRIARIFSLDFGRRRGGSSFPHGWWKPESRKGLENMSGMWNFSDAQITTDDDPKLINREQGIPHLKGCPCSVSKLSTEEIKKLETEYGSTNDLPRGPEGKVLRSDAKPNDFMFDDFTSGAWNSKRVRCLSTDVLLCSGESWALLWEMSVCFGV